ncbi:MAG: 2-C-methyl-D-erythritol 4-phosphate cytidylyltransferase [Paludibacteraceae bacterium]|nr:2-C-methyl-D-erythritol 4-phosphate cytidylyltransferase [Paludibacteraceae bacterium]MBQ6748610.1 2-C-methyl-D-erythritol 4-phosphate cytidylyltransferase [Paludibacteraceae bacterium]MBQ6764362.1 2-C-methyl-D-erythritol 4-phosphate cytidylyltransferase [Paludibacteraceae bacterium]
MNMNIAVILAGGSGSRFGRDLPKQFLKVAGKKVIEHTIDVFEHNDLIDEIAVVTQPEYIADVEQLVVNNHYRKVRKILVGGKERYHSSLSAINAYTEDTDNLIFHDAVRPLVNDRIINDCIEALKEYDAVDVAIPVADTIIQVDDTDCINAIPTRSLLRSGQTPQCFKRGVINKAYEIAMQDPNFVTTDDCGVVRKYLPETPVYVVKGEVFNMKITYKEDLFLVDKLFQLKSQEGSQEALTEKAKEQLKGKVLIVFGGSYGIGADVARLAQECGAKVYSFSRSLNHVDVSDYEQVSEALKQVYDTEGSIHFVVDTAGILVKEALATMEYERIQQSVNVNMLGIINVAKASYPYLQKTKGSLLAYTSSSYTRGRMMYSIYSATKAAVVNLVQALAEEWSNDQIRVNCINPERTKTPMRVSNFGNEPENTLLKSEEVAIASLNTLVADCTGEVIDVKRRMYGRF